MKEAIRQLFVPRTYMRHFSEHKNEDDFIWFTKAPFSSANSTKEININNICLEKHIYTLPGATAQERMFLERVYSNVFERDYNKVYDMVVDPTKITISQAERDFVITTVISMYYRTTNWNQFAYYVSDDTMDRMYHMTKQSPYDYFMMGERKISIAGKTVDELKKEHREESRLALALNQLRHAIKLASIRSISDRIMINKIGSTVDEFITSDNPVTCQNLKGGHVVPIDPTNTFCLPLDPKHSLTLIPAHRDNDKTIIHRATYAEDVSLLPMLGQNLAQEMNAQRFLLGSKAGLAGYAMAKLEFESPTPTDRFSKIKNLITEIDEFL